MDSVRQISIEETVPWHAAYPEPRAKPASISRHELVKHMRNGASPGQDFLLVDLRREDQEVRSPAAFCHYFYTR